jgi:hypothetical protein
MELTMAAFRMVLTLTAALIASPSYVVAQSPGGAAQFAKGVTGTMDFGCRQGECNQLRITKRALLRSAGNAEIYELDIVRARFESGDRAARQKAQRGEGSRGKMHVICSYRTPAVIFRDDDDPEFIRHSLSPGDDDGKAGYNLGSYKIYYATCHGLLHDDMPSQQARRLGYTAKGSAGQSEHKTLEDALKGG